VLSLPNLADFEAFRAWRTDQSQWLRIAIDIARGHDIGSTELQPFSTGTNLVVALDPRLILKIFPPMHRSQFVSERGSLLRLSGRLSVPIPMALMLLHRASDPVRHICIEGWQEKADDPEQLQELVWPT
jgi:hypothetical protein